MIMRYSSFNWNDYKARNDRGYKGRWSQGGTMQISSYFFSHPNAFILNKKTVPTVPIPSEITRVWSCLVSWSSHWEASGIVTTIFDDSIQYSSLMCHCHSRKLISQCRWWLAATFLFMPIGQTRSQLVYILVWKIPTPPQPNPKKYTKKREFVPRPRKGQGPTILRKDVMSSRCTVFQPPLFFSQKPHFEPAVSDDTLGPAHRQHPDIEEPGTPAFLLQGTQHEIKGCSPFMKNSSQQIWPKKLSKLPNHKSDATCSIETWIKENENIQPPTATRISRHGI